MKFKMDSAKLLSVAVTVLGVAGTLLSAKVQENERKTLKEELKNELAKELLKEKN